MTAAFTISACCRTLCVSMAAAAPHHGGGRIAWHAPGYVGYRGRHDGCCCCGCGNGHGRGACAQVGAARTPVLLGAARCMVQYVLCSTPIAQAVHGFLRQGWLTCHNPAVRKHWSETGALAQTQRLWHLPCPSTCCLAQRHAWDHTHAVRLQQGQGQGCAA
jgi:hypothetical protein